VEKDFHLEIKSKRGKREIGQQHTDLGSRIAAKQI
jgi:hypothetical protein